MKTTQALAITLLITLSGPSSFAQITGSAGMGGVGGGNTAGVGAAGSAGTSPATSLRQNPSNIPSSTAPATTGNTTNPGGTITTNPVTLPNSDARYNNTQTRPNTNTPGLAPLASPAQ